MKLIFPSNVLNHISEYYRNEKAFWQITELVKYNILIPINSSRLPSIQYNVWFLKCSKYIDWIHWIGFFHETWLKT